MATKTYLVTVDYDQFHTTSHARTELERIGTVAALDQPSEWPTSVWLAFERAQAERTARNIAATDNRRHEGNKLVHHTPRYDAADRCQVCHKHADDHDPERYVELSPAERIAEHTGRTEFLLKPYAR